MLYKAIKRILDFVLAGVILVITSPLLLLCIMLIVLESPGNPLYRQQRVGRKGKPFWLLKLRTMVPGAEGIGPGLALQEGDNRITRIGGLLRRVSIDELPNLINVFKGEMSIVGPRPTVQW